MIQGPANLAFVLQACPPARIGVAPALDKSLKFAPAQFLDDKCGSGIGFPVAFAPVFAFYGLACRQRGRRGCRKQCRQQASAVAVKAGSVDSVGIIGCSGAVGQEMLKCLENCDFPTKAVKLFAKRSAGQVVESAKFGQITIEPFSLEKVQECEIVLMAVSGGFSLEWAKQIAGGPKNTVVVDNSSAWRYNDEVPLVVPEINGEKISSASLIANPNCTTAIGAMALWPLHQKYKLKKVLMSTYQAASGAGAEGMAELENGVAEWAKTGVCPKPEFFAHQLPFNVIAHIDDFQENGYTKEEMKVTWELQKIFQLSEDVKISCTAVRVPTLRAHSESITVETEQPTPPDEARELLRGAQGVKVVDEPDKKTVPITSQRYWPIQCGGGAHSGESGLWKERP